MSHCSNDGFPKMEDNGDRMTFSSGAIRDTAKGKGRYDLISPIAMEGLALVLEEGANKYYDRNWEKGMHMSRLLSSALRHIFQYICGMRNERHLAQAFANIMFAIHTERMVEEGRLSPEYNDLPNYGVDISRPMPDNMNTQGDT